MYLVAQFAKKLVFKCGQMLRLVWKRFGLRHHALPMLLQDFVVHQQGRDMGLVATGFTQNGQAPCI